MNFGALISPKDLRDYRLKKVAKSIRLPSTFDLPYKIKVKDQGCINSCVAHSISSLMEANFKDIFSAGWIYGYRPFGYYQGQGMYMRDALKTIKNIGAVKNIDFNVNLEMDEAKLKVEQQKTLLIELAEKYKISSYARLDSIERIKSWIYTNKIPVPAVIKVDNLKTNNNIIEVPNGAAAAHAILIIGWNEKGFIIQNSWGPYWGNNGTAILPYNYKINEAWGVATKETQKDSIKKPFLFFIRKLIQRCLNK